MNACPPCSGNCNQGRSCSARQVCELPDGEPEELRDLGKAIAIVVCAAILSAIVAMWLAENRNEIVAFIAYVLVMAS